MCRSVHADDEEVSERFAQLLRQHMRRECSGSHVEGHDSGQAVWPAEFPAHEQHEELYRLAKRAQALEVQLAEAGEASGGTDAVSCAADMAWQVRTLGVM